MKDDFTRPLNDVNNEGTMALGFERWNGRRGPILHEYKARSEMARGGHDLPPIRGGTRNADPRSCTGLSLGLSPAD